MGLMDELKKLAHPYSDRDEDDYDDYDDDTLDEEPAPAPAAAPRRSSYTTGSRSSAESPRSSAGTGSASRVVNINATTEMQVVLVKPDRFEMVSDIADHLRNKRALVLNLEATNKDVARRLVDFLSGCAYALDGNIKKVAISTYLVTPYNVNVVDNLMEELEANGMYY